MNRPCVISIKCVGPQPGLEADSPVTNYSSEYTDGPEFHSYRFPPFRPYDPGIPGWWSAQACAGAFTCTSQISQEDADDCAAALAYVCVATPPRTPPGDPDNPPVGPELFPNQTQQASFACPDGTLFYWTIPQGTIYSTSTALANAVALALAERRVAQNFICFSALTNQPCLGVEYTDLVIVTGRNQPYTFSIVGGDLPPVLELTDLGGNQAAITGIATISGIYSVTIRATGSNGGFADKTYTISVIGILNPTELPDASVGSAYSEQLNTEGGSPPYTFTLSSGTLPDGLSIDTAGLISGTPTTEETQSFRIAFVDSLGSSCYKDFTLEVIQACWIDNVTPVQPLPIMAATGTGVSTAASGNIVYFERIQYPQLTPDGFILINPDGSGYGSIAGVWVHHVFNGGDIVIGPGNFLDQLNLYGTSDTGSAAMIYQVLGSYKIELWNPSSGSLVTVISVFVGLNNHCVGPNDHLVYEIWDGGANYDIWIWHNSTGHVQMVGSTHQGLTFQSVASNGHAAFAVKDGTAYYKAFFWDGATFSEIYDPGVSVTKISCNANDKVAGLVTTSSFFIWNAVDGLVNIGLPPGAATGNNVWITDSDIVVANANNGTWYYYNGAWGPLTDLLDPLELWSLVANTFAVTHDGYITGRGTQNGTPLQWFWCKLCSPP